jgi:uncharacterized repeat protein (TIGR03803 family)
LRTLWIACRVRHRLRTIPAKPKGEVLDGNHPLQFAGGTGGYYPLGSLVFDSKGNLYGATEFGGGRGTTCNAYFGGNCGTVFELSPPKKKGGQWTEKVLYSFAGGQAGKKDGDGGNPNGGLLVDNQTGAIYGTTFFGGNEAGECDGGSGGTGCGIVFELIHPTKQSGTWKENILFRFDGANGSNSSAGVIRGHAGSLYGTTVYGGYQGDGVVFELRKPSGKTQGWAENVLYRFEGQQTGDVPQAGLLLGANGDLYGASLEGPTGGGVVFQLKPEANGKSWTASALYNFNRAPDANNPTASLIEDAVSNLYSTTKYGGTGNCYPDGCGAVFGIMP